MRAWRNPLAERYVVHDALRRAAAAERYLAEFDRDRVRRPGADEAALALTSWFPEGGDGALAAG